MWLLGAGASAAAGIPTARDMIWEFKQQLYVSQKRVSPKTVSDLSNASIRMEVTLTARPSRCKPRDRWLAKKTEMANSCCGPAVIGSKCCA